MRELIYWYVKRPLQRLPHWIAAHMPRWLVYYCTMRLFAHATTGKHSAQVVPELTAMDALERWGR